MLAKIEVRRPSSVIIEDLLVQLQEQAFRAGSGDTNPAESLAALREQILTCIERLVAQTSASSQR
jgi:hypothetical protein